MRPMAVVVLDVLVDYGFEMSTTEDEYPIQTFTPDRCRRSAQRRRWHEVPGSESG